MLHLRKNIETVNKIMILKLLENELSILNDNELINLLDGLIEKYRTEYKNQTINKD